LQTGLSAPIQGAHFRNEAVPFGAPLILVMSLLGLHSDFDQLEGESTTIIHTGGNIRVILPSVTKQAFGGTDSGALRVKCH
jgi:hypothetical protein